MKEKARTVTVSVRVRPDEKARLFELAELLGRQLGTEVTMAQAFCVAVKEAIEKRKSRESAAHFLRTMETDNEAHKN